jgi:NlpC/P60 family putative phage cell wall peptidase
MTIPLITTPIGDAIIQEARSWIDTPFHHQAAVKGVGCDCAGLVRGVGEACGVLHIPPERWAAGYANYSRIPNPARMERVLRTFLLPVDLADVRIGDVLWLQWRRNLPMHLGLLCARKSRAMLLHALSDYRRVVEHGLTAEWRARIASAWRYPGAADGA